MIWDPQCHLSLGRGATLLITDLSGTVLDQYGPFVYIAPEPVVVSAFSVRVVFTFDQSAPLAGWKLNWAAQSLCPASCRVQSRPTLIFTPQGYLGDLVIWLET